MGSKGQLSLFETTLSTMYSQSEASLPSTAASFCFQLQHAHVKQAGYWSSSRNSHSFAPNFRYLTATVGTILIIVTLANQPAPPQRSTRLLPGQYSPTSYDNALNHSLSKRSSRNTNSTSANGRLTLYLSLIVSMSLLVKAQNEHLQCEKRSLLY